MFEMNMNNISKSVIRDKRFVQRLKCLYFALYVLSIAIITMKKSKTDVKKGITKLKLSKVHAYTGDPGPALQTRIQFYLLRV